MTLYRVRAELIYTVDLADEDAVFEHADQIEVDGSDTPIRQVELLVINYREVLPDA